MHPILTVVTFSGVAVPIGSYGACLCLALVVGGALSLRAAHRAGLDVGACTATLALAVAGGFVGAAFLHAAAQFARTGSFAYATSHVGIAWFGAVAGGALALLLAARLLGVDARCLADRSVPALAFAHAIGRVGCLFAGCCHGLQSHAPWAVVSREVLPGAGTWTIAADAVPRHPVQLYEAAFLVLLGCLFVRWPPRDAGSGRAMTAYLGLYAAFRIVIECLRGDLVRGVFLDGAVSTSQLAGALLIAICVAWRQVGRHAACVPNGIDAPRGSRALCLAR